MKIITKDNLDHAAIILKHGGIIAFPTETVYGLGVRCDDEELYNKLVEVKNRRPDQPFTIMCSNVNQIKNYLEIDDVTSKIIDKFMPGPITLIGKAKSGLNTYLDLGTGFIGVRVPNNKLVLDLISKVGVPLLVPSANPTGLEPALSSIEVVKYFDGKLDAVIEGDCKSNIPSTIIKVENGETTLIREGELSLKNIMEAIK